MSSFCEVALPVPLDRTFTYAAREGQNPRRGARVIVPFRNEKLIGVVISLGDAAPADYEVRYLETVLDEDSEEPLLSDHLLSLGEWMAQYYLAPLGEVLRGMLPLMAEVRRIVYYRITDLGRDMLARMVEENSGQSAAGPGNDRKSRIAGDPNCRSFDSVWPQDGQTPLRMTSSTEEEPERKIGRAHV